MSWLKEFYTSIFRGASPSTNRGKAELVFYSLWLHIHPVKVQKEHLRLAHTFYLGFASVALLVLLVLSGIPLLFYYHPSPSEAYQNIKDLQYAVFLGSWVRNVHWWSAAALVAIAFLHMCRVFWTGSYKTPRQFNWVVGLGLFFVILSLSFTGRLLPWDQASYWAVTVGANLLAYVPGAGHFMRLILLGGHTLGGDALLRFYVIHIVVLPLALSLLLMVHLWRVRKDGGLSRPLWKLDDTADGGEERLAPAAPEKTYGLMASVTGEPVFEVLLPEQEEDLVFSYPYAFLREGVAFLFTTAAVMALSLLFNAPLEELANPAKTPNPAKAPWYFLGIQELASHGAFLGGVLVPGLAAAALIALPYLDRNPSRRPRDRRLAIWLFTLFAIANIVLIIVGSCFRGGGWGFILPWAQRAAEGVR